MRHLLKLVLPLLGSAPWSVTPDQSSLLEKGNIGPELISRLFVISDIHGDFDALVTALYMAMQSARELRSQDWVLPSIEDLGNVFLNAMDGIDYFADKGDVYPYFKDPEHGFYLVQMGDLIDRGPHSQWCLGTMELVSRVIGFHVIQLLGNHDLMAVIAPTVAASKNWVHKEDTMARNEGSVDALLDYIGRNMLVMTRIGGSSFPPLADKPSSSAATLFVHGGISSEWIDDEERGYLLLRDSNSRVLKSVRTRNVENLGKYLRPKTSPVWSRVMSVQESDCEWVDQVLAIFNVARIVVGHTPQSSRHIELNCEGKVIMTDNAMSGYMLLDQPRAPAIMVMSFEAGRLVEIKADYFSGESEILINADGSTNKPSLTDETPQADEQVEEGVLMKDDSVVIQLYEYGGVGGLLVITIAHDESKLELVKKVQSSHNLSAILPRIIVLESPVDDEVRYFLHSTATSMLSDLGAVKSQKKAIVAFFKNMEALGVCVDPSTNPSELFGVSPNGLAEFVNLSRFRACEPKKVKK